MSSNRDTCTLNRIYLLITESYSCLKLNRIVQCHYLENIQKKNSYQNIGNFSRIGKITYVTWEIVSLENLFLHISRNCCFSA